MGLASLGISIISAIGMFINFVFAGVIESSSHGGMSEDSLEAVVIGLFLFAFLGLDLIAIGLGIAGIFQKARDRITAVLGVIIATSTVLITLSIVIIGIFL